MPTLPPVPHRQTRADPDMRAIGLLALALVLAAAIASMAWTRVLDGHGPAMRGSEQIGATLARFDIAGDEAGVVVDSVRADGAARRGGLLVGDVIEAVNGAPVRSVDAADRALLGQRLDIRVSRGKREFDLRLDASGGTSRGQQGPVDRG